MFSSILFVTLGFGDCLPQMLYFARPPKVENSKCRFSGQSIAGDFEKAVSAPKSVRLLQDRGDSEHSIGTIEVNLIISRLRNIRDQCFHGSFG